RARRIRTPIGWLCSLPAFFFFRDPAPTEIYTLSLHDALPISARCGPSCNWLLLPDASGRNGDAGHGGKRRVRRPEPCSVCCHGKDRKSTRLNSSHVKISYAVFCLKKKKQIEATEHARREETTD